MRPEGDHVRAFGSAEGSHPGSDIEVGERQVDDDHCLVFLLTKRLSLLERRAALAGQAGAIGGSSDTRTKEQIVGNQHDGHQIACGPPAASLI